MIHYTEKELTKKAGELVASLCDIMSVSGHEEKGRAALQGAVGEYFDEYLQDESGTHIFIKRCGAENAPKLMLDAHFDEIGMFVTDIHEGGFLSVCQVGGLDRRILPAAEVKIYSSETLYGVIVSKPPHLQADGENKKNPEIADLLIDTGYSEEKLREKVEIGTPVGFYESVAPLCGERVAGRSLDNKACCTAAVLAAMISDRDEMKSDLYLTLSSREETGLSDGCSAAAYKIRPDAAIVTDVTFATAPDVKPDESGEFGGGGVISLSAVTDRRFTARLIALGRENDIPFQTCVDAADTGTNATMLSLCADGVVTAVVSVPLSSMHTYNESVDLADIVSAARLFSAALCTEGVITGKELSR